MTEGAVRLQRQADGDLRLLAEMLRECERAIDHQVRAMEELDDKTEHMLTLCVAVLGGGVALATFAIANVQDLLHASFAVGILLAGSLNVVALALFSGAYLGFRRHAEFHLGPRLSWIAAKSNDDTWARLDHVLSAIKDYPSYWDWNAGQIALIVRLRRAALYVLLGALCSYGFAFAYILKSTIRG